MGCNICKSVESRKKKKQINCDGSSNNKNKEIEPVNSKKDDKLENKIQLVKNKYNKIKSYIKEVINKENEYQNIILYIEKINTDNNNINEDEIKELKIKSENLDKKLKLKEDNRKHDK